MGNDIKASIITPVYNSFDTIQRTIESVLNQTHNNLEYIIVDGGSNDGTLDIIKKYKEKFSDKIKYVSEKDLGIYDAINKGIKIATGDIVGIISSNDWYELDSVRIALSSFKNEEHQVIYGMAKIFKESKELGVFIKNHNFLLEQMIIHPSCFISKKTYDKFGLYNISYKSSSDYEYMIKLYISNYVIFKPVYHVLSNFNLGGISSSILGYSETLKIKLKYGLISRKKYLRLNILVRFKKIYNKFKYRNNYD